MGLAMLSLIGALVTPPLVEVQSPTIDIRINSGFYPGALTLPPKDPKSAVINVDDPNGDQRFCIVQATEACIVVPPGEPRHIDLRHNGSTFRYEVRNAGPEVDFSPAYVNRWRGSVRVENPRAYELVNIAIAITATAGRRPYLTRSDSVYSRMVAGHFRKLADHEFIRSIEQLLVADEANYNRIRVAAATLELNPSGATRVANIYERIKRPNVLKPLMAQMSDFATRSKFEAFYRRQTRYYAQVRKQLDPVPGLEWLYKQFPSVDRPDAVRVLFSPLVGGSQMLQRTESNGFTELRPHVGTTDPAPHTLSASASKLFQTHILFTEVNHGFINPTSVPLVREITTNMGDVHRWSNPKVNPYTSPKLIFDEMMNWALISVWAQETLAPSDARMVAGLVSRRMLDRGFPLFARFQDAVLTLRRENPGMTVASTYPAIVNLLPSLISSKISLLTYSPGLALNEGWRRGAHANSNAQ